jgi:hypothetical protein
MDQSRHHLVSSEIRISDITDEFECDFEDDFSYGDEPINNRNEAVHDALIWHGVKNDFKECYYNGIVIETTHDPIVFAISTQRGCCERFGVYFEYPDAMTKKDFIGAVVTNIRWGKEIRDDECEHKSSEIIVETSRGSFSIFAYNDHNGYYSHHVYAVFNGLIEEFSL